MNGWLEVVGTGRTEVVRSSAISHLETISSRLAKEVKSSPASFGYGHLPELQSQCASSVNLGVDIEFRVKLHKEEQELECALCDTLSKCSVYYIAFLTKCL